MDVFVRDTQGTFFHQFIFQQPMNLLPPQNISKDAVREHKNGPVLERKQRRRAIVLYSAGLYIIVSDVPLREYSSLISADI